jgi:hypothetical protein
MVDRFKAHAPEDGPRLEQIQGLGRRGGLAAQYRDAPTAAVRAAEELVKGTPGTKRLGAEGVRRVAEKVGGAVAVGRNKGGRPGLGEPWKALGLSRAAYFRRKKEGAL